MKSIGIDLGTTNTVAAIHYPGRGSTEVVENGQAKSCTPSVVAVRTRKAGEEVIVVGQDAVDGAGNATCTVFSVKRLMGRGVSEPQIADVRRRFNYEVVPAAEDDPTAAIQMGGAVRTPSEISSMILAKVRRDAAVSLGGEVTHAVITVPAYFEVAQRAATRKAAEAAGLKVKRLIDEPTAAAIAFGMREAGTEGKRVLVYDLGGGTFDISLLQMVQDGDGRSHFQVVGAAGDNWLGGDDFDDLIVDKVLDQIRSELGAEPPVDQMFRRNLKERAEKVKWSLNEQDFAEVNLPAAFRLPGNGPWFDVYVEFTREQVNRMFAPLIARTMALVDDVLAEGNFVAEDVTDVLLVGGSTLMTTVRETVTGRFGVDKVRMDVRPMECVALGAAILANTEAGLECPNCAEINNDEVEVCQKCEHSLLGVAADDGIVIYEQTAMALGIAAIDGDNPDAFVEIIPRGTKYPLRESMKKMFTAAGRRVRIPVHEGVHKVASKNRVQGVVEAELPEGLEPNSDVEVSFNYDRDRVVTVVVRVPGTTFVQAVTLHPQVVEDRPAAVADDAKENLEQAIDMVEDFLVKFDSYLEPFHRDRIQVRLARAKQAFRGSDNDELQRLSLQLLRDLETAGLASTLYVADIVVDRAEPADSEHIRRTAQALREAHEQRNEARLAYAEKILRELTERVLRKLAGGTIEDPSDLLRTHGSLTSR